MLIGHKCCINSSHPACRLPLKHSVNCWIPHVQTLSWATNVRLSSRSSTLCFRRSRYDERATRNSKRAFHFQDSAIVLDLSAQKKAEASLREREQRFRVLAESLPDFVWIRQADGEYVYCNRCLLDYVGQPAEWLQSQAFDAVHPDDLSSTIHKWNHCMETGEPYLNEYRLRRYDGAYRYFLVRAVPVRNEAGKIKQWLGSSTDIHDRRLAEEALRRSEKLATAGRLAASIAREINNPFAAVTNALYLAMQEQGLSEQARAYLKLADQELARVAHVTTHTLRLHKQSSAPTLVDVGEVMDSVFSLFAPRFKASAITVEGEYQASKNLYCFNDELRQVFANLIGNALDAIPHGGKVRLRIKHAGFRDAWEAGASEW